MRYGGIRPELTETELELTDMINPEICDLLSEQGRSFVPVSIRLEQGATVITGANMGGKSVAMKTVALNALLLQAGFLVCAKKARMPLFHSVKMLFDDLQSIQSGLSGFGSEIVQFQKALTEVEKGYSLFLLDEFARGTNPDEGAAILHIHVREDDGTPTQNRDRFKVVMDAIRKELPDVIMIPSTGGATGMSPEERLQPTELFPEMATLDCGTCNFGDEIFDNTMPTMRAFGKRMIENGIKPEYECFELGHIDTILGMAKKGEVPGHPMQFNFVLGVHGCTPATVENLAFFASKIPADATWTVSGVGRAAWTMAAAAIAMGGNVRVGFEDNIYLGKGQKAASNGELVAKVVRIAKELGREIATPAEAREILSLKPLQ